MFRELPLSPFYLWLRATRPKTLVASFAPVIMSFSIATNPHWTTFFLTLLYALSIQIGTNFANDYFDFLKKADTPKRKGPIRPLQAGLIAPKTMHNASKGVLCFALVIGICLVMQHTTPSFLQSFFLLCLALCVACAFLYTAGPFSIAYKGLAEIFVLVFFGSLATWGTYFLQTGLFSFPLFLLGLSPGALSAAILVANNLRDYEEDRMSNKNTLVVRWGKTFGKIEYTFFLLLPPIIPFYFALTGILEAKYTGIGLYYFPCFFYLRAFFQTQDYHQALENSAKLLIFFTFLFVLLRFL